MTNRIRVTAISALAVLIAQFGLTALAQTGQPGPNEQPVRIGVTLVQVDAVVTDKHGNIVTDLIPEDFEISVDGKQQAITNFSFIQTATARPFAPAIASPRVSNAPPPPEAKLSPEQVRRVIVLAIDDLRMSFESMALVRRGLKTFIEQQMQPRDLVAIVRTSGGAGVLQQFTSNKEQLEAVADHVKWSPVGMARVSSIDPIEPGIFPTGIGGGPGQAAISAATARANGAQAGLNQFRSVLYQRGSLDSLGYIIEGMRDLPGRKSLILFSDGLNLYRDETHPDLYTMDPLRRLVDLANRSSVVINTVDARGLQTLGFNASDSVNASNRQLLSQMGSRHLDFYATQQGLEYLAGETGGLSEHDTNDLGRAVRHIVDGQSGYYLIGFIPDDSIFKPVNGRRPFHRISVKLKKSGLRVRSRKGFLGRTDDETQPARQYGPNPLIAALASPFTSQDIQVRLTSLFWNSAKNGSFIYSLLHVDPSHLTFSDDSDGWHKASFDVAEMVFGDRGQALGRVTKTQTIRVSDSGYRYIMQQGLAFADRFPLKSTGPLQYRVAIKDDGSGQIGTATSFVNAPEINSGRLLLSGIFLQQSQSTPVPAAVSGPQESETQNASQHSDVDPALRVFKPGANLGLSFIVYNANPAIAAGQGLTAQIRLFREGQLVYTSPAATLTPTGQPDPKRIGAEMKFRLGDQLEAGDYVLQVLCSQKTEKGNPILAGQWVDLQIVK